MKNTLVAFAMLSLVRACGGTEEVPPVSSAPPIAAPRFALNATHGGSVLLVEDQWVEVVPKSDGSVEAYVVDANGAPLAAPATTMLSVKVNGDDGAQHDVVLPWNPTTSRFEGRLVDVQPAPGPVEVTVIVAGRPPRRATAPVVIISPALPPSASRPVVVVEGRPIAPRPQVVVVAPEPPRPVVVVQERRGPDVIVVEERRGPDVVVVERDGHRGRGHAYGHDRRGGVVVVAPDPRPTVVISPPRPGVVVVGPRGPGVVVRSGGRGDHDDDHDRGERGHGGRGGGHGGGRGGGRGRH